MKVARSPLASQIPSNKSWMLEGSRAYTDPFSLGTNISERLDVLLLLLDRVFVSEPTNDNLRRWKYDESRFSSLVQERMYVPLYVANEPNEVYGGENFLIRRNILGDEEFNPIYDTLTDEDSQDPIFIKLAKKACRATETPLDLSFNLGWDFIVSQMLMAPVIIGKRYEQLLRYRVESSNIDSLAQVSNTDELSSIHIVKFLYRVLNRLPSDLSVEQLKNFRKDRIAAKFRKWLDEELQKAMEARKKVGMKIDEAMERDFMELVSQNSKSGSRMSWAVTGSVGFVSTILAGPFAGFLGAFGSAILPKAIKSFWNRYGSRNWAYLILRMRK